MVGPVANIISVTYGPSEFLALDKEAADWIHKSVVIKSPMSKRKCNNYYYVCKQVSLANINVGGLQHTTLHINDQKMQCAISCNGVGYNVSLEDK